MPDQKTPVVVDGLAVKELIAHGAGLGQIKDGSGRAPFTVLPDGFHVELLKPAEPNPLRDYIEQQVTLEDAESFIAYVKLFRTATTRIFATPLDLGAIKSPKAAAVITALLNYHQPGSEATPARNAHIARYPLPLSVELQLWLAQDGNPLPQLGFIEFIEANQVDIVSPDAAKLMEMILNFESKTEVRFQSAITRVSGNRILTYKEDNDMGDGQDKKLTVPEFMTIRVPVFEAGKAFDIKARMEYRASSAKLNITFHLQRPQQALRDAFKEIRAQIEAPDTGAGVPILTGAAKL